MIRMQAAFAEGLRLQSQGIPDPSASAGGMGRASNVGSFAGLHHGTRQVHPWHSDRSIQALIAASAVPLELAHVVLAVLEAPEHPGDGQPLPVQPEIAAALAAWIQAAAPGSNLSGVLPRYLANLLDQILSPRNVLGRHMTVELREAVQHIADLAHRRLGGQFVSAMEWGLAGKVVAMLGRQELNRCSTSIAALAAAITRPADERCLCLPPAIHSLFRCWLLVAVDDVSLSNAAIAKAATCRPCKAADAPLPDRSRVPAKDGAVGSPDSNVPEAVVPLKRGPSIAIVQAQMDCLIEFTRQARPVSATAPCARQ